MDYQVISVSASFFGINFSTASEKLTAQVKTHIAQGWEPQGGVCVGTTHVLKRAYLFQAMVRRR